MTKRTKTAILWSTRGLAAIGAVAIVLLIVNLVLNLTAQTTGSRYAGEFSYDDYAMGEPVFMMADMEESMVSSYMAPQERLANEAIAAEVDQKIIKTGTIDLVIDSAEESLEEINTLIQNVDGYVQSSSLREQTDGTTSGSVTIRVPADRFDETLENLKDLALVVERETISAEDVTEQYIDVASRLENAKAQEERYVEILDVATTVEEILEIEAALGNIRGYIESLTGQLQYLDSVTSFSTITISLSEEPAIIVAGKEFRPGTTVKEAGQAVIAIGQWLIEATIWIVIVGGAVILPIALLIWGARKLIRQRKNK